MSSVYQNIHLDDVMATRHTHLLISTFPDADHRVSERIRFTDVIRYSEPNALHKTSHRKNNSTLWSSSQNETSDRMKHFILMANTDG